MEHTSDVLPHFQNYFPAWRQQSLPSLQGKNRFELLRLRRYARQPATRSTSHRLHTKEWEILPGQEFTFAPPPTPTVIDLDEELDVVDLDYIREATTLYAVFDSSVDPIDGTATFNWCVTTAERRGLVSRSDFMQSNPKYMNSYRGEFVGLKDLTAWLVQNDLHRKQVQISCNNEGCVNMLQYFTMELTDLDKAEADLIRDTRANQSKFTDVEVLWVKGHQDEHVTYDELPLLAQLNVDCDAAANKHLQEGSHPTTSPVPLPGSKATLFFGNNMVTPEINEQI